MNTTRAYTMTARARSVEQTRSRILDATVDLHGERLAAGIGLVDAAFEHGERAVREERRVPVGDGVLLMLGAMHAAREAGLRYAVLEHLYDAYYRRGCLGGPLGISLRLLATVPELDPVPSPPANVRRIGPVVDVAPREDVDRPRVLVSLGTFGFAGMTDTLRKLVDATRGLGADVVVTTPANGAA